MAVMPPSIHELLSDPVYRSYVKKIPSSRVTYAGITRPHPALDLPDNWQVWLKTSDKKWRTARYSTYAEAWAVLAKNYKLPATVDIAIVSRRVFYPPPKNFVWDPLLEWCARCRRPSTFTELSPRHHALRSTPSLTDDEPYRCVYCGIRRAAFTESYNHP